MNILLISQCRKKALTETRRILDQFAERCGDRTWQTAITQAGLNTLHRLLKQTARKNTAVACHYSYGKKHSELLWIVGDRRQFNAQGRTPTNRSQRNLLRHNGESPWHQAASIQIVAVLAALLHDLGKATVAFQRKLRGQGGKSDPYRHEWLSLCLLHLMLNDCDTNEACLVRLRDWEDYRAAHPNWYHAFKHYQKERSPDFSTLPPLARWLAWLIASHHRMPLYQVDYYKNRAGLRQPTDPYLKITADAFYNPYYLKPADGWVHNPNIRDNSAYWTLDADPTTDARWQKTLRRWAGKALNHPPLHELCAHTVSDPLILHLSRLCLMTADHSHSAAPADTPCPADALYANTDRDGNLKQTLVSHLCGVAAHAARIARELPQLPHELPALINHRPFRKPTQKPEYQWQNQAYTLAQKLQADTAEHGFFGINLASTGSGKTLANARIMYGLANPERGARFTIALGLRILTLQTGQALRDKLHLNDNDSLATLVGGGATRELYLHYQQSGAPIDNPDDNPHQPTQGSESIETLVPQDYNLDNGDIDGYLPEGALGSTIQEPVARQLLATPIISCTIDHLMQACEQQRGGRYIIPMLRLLSSDLVLDEPDDFGNDDLPALSRLVYWAGMLGSRVLLSAATITPAMACGLHRAYQDGRDQWRRQQGLEPSKVMTAWFNEKHQHSGQYDPSQYEQAHHDFCQKIITTLQAQPVRRRAEIINIDSETQLVSTLSESAYSLHQAHAQTDPNSGKTLSIGLIRFANIDPLMRIAQKLLQQPPPENTAIHFACYHANQLLIQRSRLEHRLDTILNRHDPNALWQQPDIRRILDNHPAQQHICIVLASPVCEVGRDHDYDWGIVEPSSMRSIIQLAGRIWRHRPDKTVADTPNLYLLSRNIRALHSKKTCYTRPGYESETFHLSSYDLNDLITTNERAAINAIPRLHVPAAAYDTNLSALEHEVIRNLLDEKSFTARYRDTNGAAVFSAHHALISPFRAGRTDMEYIALWNHATQSPLFKTRENAWRYRDDLKAGSDNATFNQQSLTTADGIYFWLHADLKTALEEIADDEQQLNDLALRYASVSLYTHQDGSRWQYHPWGGFWHE